MRFSDGRSSEFAGLLLGVLLLHLPACIESRCYGDGDCALGKVCLEETGKCLVPECSDTKPCLSGYSCVKSSCVETPYQEECNCTDAPPFCAVDINPNSSGAGQEVCSDASGEGGLALFFGSVNCPHCWAIFKGVELMRDGLLAAGYPVKSYFAHIKNVEASPTTVGEKMEWATSPVVADTEELAIWDDYLATWYHFVIIDKHGCVVSHFGPVAPEDFDGDDSPIRQAWIDSLSSECPGRSGADIGPDLSDTVSPDVTLQDVVEIVDFLVPDGSADETDALPDLVPELVDVTDFEGLLGEVETTSAADTLPETVIFEPAEFCQVVPIDPIELGDPLPNFLCVDANPSSPTYEGTFSPDALKGKVWLAYFGSCT